MFATIDTTKSELAFRTDRASRGVRVSMRRRRSTAMTPTEMTRKMR